MAKSSGATPTVLVRVVTGVIVGLHGLRKLIAGPPAVIGGLIAAKHMPFPSLLAWLVALGELTGFALALGYKTRLAGAAIALTMGAIFLFVHAASLTQFGTGPGTAGEYPLLLALLGAFFAAVGPGGWALEPR